MQNNKKTTRRNHSSSTRDLLWFVYKRFLIGLAMYLCYKCLHFSPLIYDITELALCSSIILIFSAIISHHATAKKAADYPDQFIFPSPLALIGGGLSWVIYFGLILYGIYQLTFVSGETQKIEQIFLKLAIVPPTVLIIYLIIPDLVKSIISPFSYLKK